MRKNKTTLTIFTRNLSKDSRKLMNDLRRNGTLCMTLKSVTGAGEIIFSDMKR